MLKYALCSIILVVIVSYTTIQIDVSTRKRLGELKEYSRETYNDVLSKLLALVPEGDEEGHYSTAFRASLLHGLLDARRGRVHSEQQVRKQLGLG